MDPFGSRGLGAIRDRLHLRRKEVPDTNVFGRGGSGKKEWAELCRARATYGEQSPEYTRAGTAWVAFLGAETRVLGAETLKVERESEELQAKVMKIIEKYGRNSPEFTEVLKEIEEMGVKIAKVTKRLKALRAATSSYFASLPKSL